MPDLPWIFEPCSPEDATDTYGDPWPHAVKGIKPGGRRVMGYGYTPPAAQYDAERKARAWDENERIGPRGEVLPPLINPYFEAAAKACEGRRLSIGDAWADVRALLKEAGLLK